MIIYDIILCNDKVWWWCHCGWSIDAVKSWRYAFWRFNHRESGSIDEFGCGWIYLLIFRWKLVMMKDGSSIFSLSGLLTTGSISSGWSLSISFLTTTGSVSCDYAYSARRVWWIYWFCCNYWSSWLYWFYWSIRRRNYCYCCCCIT